MRNYFADLYVQENHIIKYDKSKNRYYLVEDDTFQLRNDEILVISKILLESRSFCETEIHQIINKLVSIMFSEYYFYLRGYISKSSEQFPIIFRVDQIEYIEATGKKIKVLCKDRFEEGKFRKRVHFMYSGSSHEVALDKLPSYYVYIKGRGLLINVVLNNN